MTIKPGWIILFFLILFYLFYKLFFIDYLSLKLESPLDFHINKGESFNLVLNRFCNKNNLNFLECKGLYFDLKSNFTGLDKIKPGVYFLSGITFKQIFLKFKKGPDIKYECFTIYPGDTKLDISYNLKKKISKLYMGSVAKDISNKFLQLVDDKNFILKLKNKSEYSFLQDFGDIVSLEGFLYPETYCFKRQDYKSKLFPYLFIKTVLKEFKKRNFKLFEECKNNVNCNPYDLTFYENMIIASIVQKEEKDIENMRYISDILIRRYKNGWLLGADWTLCYGLGILSKECNKYLGKKYLEDKTNPYNTRANKGLPPTPVGNFTDKVLKATLYPKQNNYWYYLHGCKGKIYFAETLNKHILNKKNLCYK